MELYWKNADNHDHNDGGLDLDDVWMESGVIDVESFKLAILHHIALWAMEKGYSLDRIVGFTLDNDGGEIDMRLDSDDAGDWTWLDNVANLVEHLQGSLWLDVNMFLAAINNEGWDSFDWDNLSAVEDRYSQEWDGDYEEFAKEWMDNTGEGLPDNLERYFDYREYGEHLIEDDYEILEFAGNSYLFRSNW